MNATLAVFMAVFIFICIFTLPIAIEFGSLSNLFTGTLSDKEFDTMMDLIFNDPNASLDRYDMRGAGYECWIANGYYAFRVNGEHEFTPLQKIKFFRRMNAWKKQKNAAVRKVDRLYRDKLNNIIFQKELESKLEKE